MPPKRRVVPMPVWMDFIDAVGPTNADGGHRTKSTQPWLGRKPASLRSDMKTIIADFKRSAKLREMEERDDMLLRGIGGSFPASATEADSKQQAPVLEDSDRMLAQNIYITDMQANMYQLKRAIASEQQRFKNEITKAQIEVETVNQREVELNAQNSFLRDAILEGRLGNAINVQRFQELYEEIVRAEADYEQNSGDIKEWDELSPASSPKLQTNRKDQTEQQAESVAFEARCSFTESFPATSIERTEPSSGEISPDSFARTGSALKQRTRRNGPTSLLRTPSDQVGAFISHSYNPSAPKRTSSSTSRRNVLLPRPAAQQLAHASTVGPKSRPLPLPGTRKTKSEGAYSPQSATETLSARQDEEESQQNLRHRANKLANNSSWSESGSSTDEEAPFDHGQEHLNSLVPRYMSRLMQCHQASPGDLPLHSMTGTEAEFLKRQPLVLDQVADILSGSENFKKLRNIIDSCDAKCRVDMVDVLAGQVKFVGMLLRVMHSLEDLSKSPLDPSVNCQHFVQEVKQLIGANNVRLWLVDDKKSLIWEWVPGQREAIKRPFVVSSKINGDAQSAEDLAVQAMTLHDDTLHSDSAVLCHPIRYKGAIVAVIQCFLDGFDSATDSRARSFSERDDLLLRFVSELSGFMFHRTKVFVDSMLAAERSMRLFALTCQYHCSAQDLYTLTVMQLRHTQGILGASLCLVYLTFGAGLGEGKLWTRRADGLDTTIEISYGVGIVGWVAEEETPVVSNDVENDKRFDIRLDTAYAAGMSEKKRTFRVKSLMCIPMKRHDGTLFGVCSMIKDEQHDTLFTRADQHVLELHCELAVLSFKEVLPEDITFKPYETVADTLKRCKTLLNAEFALFLQMVPDRTKLRLETPVQLSVPIADPLLGYVARTGVPVTIADASLDPRFNPDLAKCLGSRITTMMCLPVRDDKDMSILHGIIFIGNRVPGSTNSIFDDEDASIASIIAKQIGEMLTLDDKASLSRSANRNQTSMQDMEREEDARRK